MSTAKAAELYAQASEGEDSYPPAICALGLCCELGAGVEQDMPRAVELYREAAERGYVPAQCNLGFCYYRGIGVEEDDAQAAQWFARAAEEG